MGLTACGDKAEVGPDPDDGDSDASDDTGVDDDDDGSPDQDGDGWDATEDCDDEDASVHPGAEESCNGIDDDCDDSDPDADADNVEVCPGTWVESLSVFKALELSSYNGDPATTVLDAGGGGTVIKVNSVDLTLTELTLTGGSAAYGGGVLADTESP